MRLNTGTLRIHTPVITYPHTKYVALIHYQIETNINALQQWLLGVVKNLESIVRFVGSAASEKQKQLNVTLEKIR